MEELSKSERIIELAGQRGVLRPRDLAAEGIQPEYLRRFCDRGVLRKIGRGSYVLASRPQSPWLPLAVVARAVPNGVICLRSAAAFHGCGETPEAVDLAIERHAARPRLDQPRLHIARLSGEAFDAGVQVHNVDAVQVRIYTLEKTLADLFKFRNKIGPHLAVDALRSALRQHLIDRQQLDHFAGLCRVDKIMRPYVQALERERSRA